MTPPLTVRHLSLPGGSERALRSLLEEAIPGVAPALSLVVLTRGRTAIDLACGWADPETREHPATPDLRFDLASVTKTVVATAVLGLVGEGRVGLDDRLVDHLPWFGSPAPRPVDGGQEPLTRVMLPAPTDRRWWLIDPAGVTIRQLLSHTSGLAPWRSLFQVTGPTPPAPTDLDPVGLDERWEAARAAIRTYPFVDRPGASIRYSDLGFILLGMLAAGRDDAPLSAVVARRVAGPLGLATLGYRPLDEGVPRGLVAPTSHDGLWRGRRSWGEAEDENATGLGGVAGHAGLFATAADIAAFGEAWRAADPRLGLDAAVRTTAIEPVASDAEDRRGLGWQLPLPTGSWMGPAGPGAFGHTGFTGTSLLVDPGRELVVACLTNRVWAGRANVAIKAFLPRLHALLAEADPLP